MLESAVEDYFCKRVEYLGGWHAKLISPGRRGRLDRVACLPDGYWIIVELKRPKGGKTSWHQTKEITALARLKARVYQAHTIETVDAIFEEYRKGRPAT